VSDWVPLSTRCSGWDDSFSDDAMCLAGAATKTTAGGPGALSRGGSFEHGAFAGVFAVSGAERPYDATYTVGFRCVR
jgi:hypothetical protein